MKCQQVISKLIMLLSFPEPEASTMSQPMPNHPTLEAFPARINALLVAMGAQAMRVLERGRHLFRSGPETAENQFGCDSN
jgi:hypothetical protein